MDIVERLRRTELHHVWDDLEGKMVGKMFSANPDGPEAADEIKRLREILCPELAFDDLKLIKGNWLAPKRDFKAVIEARLTALKESE